MPMFLARTWLKNQGEVEQRTLLPPSPGYEAVVAGSCAVNTQRQVTHFEKHHPVFRVDLLKASEDSNYIDKIEDWAKENIKDGPVCVSTSADVEGVKRSQAKLGRDAAAALADKAAQIAYEAFKKGKTIREVLKENKILSDKKIEKLLDPKLMIKPK